VLDKEIPETLAINEGYKDLFRGHYTKTQF